MRLPTIRAVLGALSIFSVRDDYRMNDPACKVVLLAPTKRRRTMKYICLGYIEPGKFEGMTEDERHATFDERLQKRTSPRSTWHNIRYPSNFNSCNHSSPDGGALTSDAS